MANLPSDCNTIASSLGKRQRKHIPSSRSTESVNEAAMEGSHPAQPAEPGTLKTSLLDTPGIENMTEKESAHPLSPPDVEINKSDESYEKQQGESKKSISQVGYEKLKIIFQVSGH